MSEPLCPECQQPLSEVRYPSNSMLNRDQWESVRAGDWYCEGHTNGRGNRPYAYYWNREVSASPDSKPSPIEEKSK